MDDLATYLKHIVEPTFEDWSKNPGSARHAFVSCLVVHHAADRAAYPKSRGNLLKAWRKECVELRFIEVVANQFKHVRADEGPPQKGRLPLSFAVFGKNEDEHNATMADGYRLEMRNLWFAVRDAIKFLHKKAEERI